jgi:hypothetical protein
MRSTLAVLGFTHTRLRLPLEETGDDFSEETSVLLHRGARGASIHTIPSKARPESVYSKTRDLQQMFRGPQQNN